MYLRVSTDEQNASLEAQRETCTPLAKQHGYDIVSEFLDENVSGAIAIDKRPSLKPRNVRVALEIDEDYASAKVGEFCSAT